MVPRWVERWWVRSVSRTGCNPSVFLAVAAVILIAIIMKYASVIATTIEITLIAVAGILVLAGLGMLAYTVIGWNSGRARSRATRLAGVPEATPAPAAGPGTVTVPDDIAGISDEEKHVTRAREILANKK